MLKRCLVRSEGLEPPRCYSLPPQGSASTNSATSAKVSAGRANRADRRRRFNKSMLGGQELRAPQIQGFAPAFSLPNGFPAISAASADLDRDLGAVDQHHPSGDAP